MSYSGSSKIEFCKRLGTDWKKLADYLEIPPSDQNRFERGDEGRGIWEWLQQRTRLQELSTALEEIHRADLASALEEQAQTSFDNYFQERIEHWSTERFALDRHFVQLTLLLDQGEDSQGPRWAPQPTKFQDLRQVLSAMPEHRALVLLGPPGSGKSTLLGHVELDCAQEALNRDEVPLTFFLPLNLYRPDAKGDKLPAPRTWLEERWASMHPDLPPLDTLLHEAQVILLLDALNEMPHQGNEHIEAWRDCLALLVTERPKTRVIFSCRTQDYGALLSTTALPVPQVRIEPLSDQQVREFLEKYRPQQEETLWDELSHNPRQLDLYRSPYYLTMLLKQAGPEGQIPLGRAALFTGFVRRALQREVMGNNPLFRPDELLTTRDVQRLTLVRTWKTPYELPTRGILFDKLSTLAFEMQWQRSEKEASQVRIDYDTALDILDHEQAEDILKAGEALGVLEEDLGREEVLYLHQLLQEYFAARRLTQVPEPRLVKVAWRIEQISPSLGETLASLADSDPLPPLPGTGWEETTVLAAAMVENPDAFVATLMEANLPLAGRCAAQPDVAIAEGLRVKLQQALIGRTQNPKADLRARIAAGLALGALGDPRFERCQGPEGQEYLLPPLVTIPGGTYTIGSDEGHYDRESPVHGVALTAFQMGQFPVTNAEWALFMKAGGYEDERWWETAADKAWRRGEGTAEGPKQEEREFRQNLQQHFDEIRGLLQAERITSKQADDWEQLARMSDDELESLLNKWYSSGRQTQPMHWDDDAYNNPAQPVVGISWFEARAYCAWLSVQTGQLFRLPTEVEWEAAARGVDNRRYAYGNDFDAARGNTFETHIRHTTPIGVFPGGETPGGLVDMTGNTWDWTNSLYQPYPYDAKDGREAPEAEDGRRVVRGGGWFFNRLNARAAFRHYYIPGGRLNLLGLRVLSLAPISEH